MHRHQLDIQAPVADLCALLRAPGFDEVTVPHEGLGLIALGKGTGYINGDSKHTRIRVMADVDCEAVTRLVERIRASGLGTTHLVLD
jgi:hypothetical protein